MQADRISTWCWILPKGEVEEFIKKKDICTHTYKSLGISSKKLQIGRIITWRCILPKGEVEEFTSHWRCLQTKLQMRSSPGAGSFQKERPSTSASSSYTLHCQFKHFYRKSYTVYNTSTMSIKTPL